jgi:arylsulfatase A-like enzyme
MMKGRLDSRSTGLALAAAVIAVATTACPGRAREETRATPHPAPRPSLNVLFITIDTLRPDHMGAYGYARRTSPRMDQLAQRGTLFTNAFTYWPKTRGSFVAIMTGRRASQTGYSKTHPLLLDSNPTLAGVLQQAGYDTAAAVDNANVAASLGFARGFRSYRETWEEPALKTEVDRTLAITRSAVDYFGQARPGQPFFLWLHYVNPHTPYTPPAPYDTAFLDAEARSGRKLKVVTDLHGGIPHQWAVPGKDQLGYYVAQYDGEIAAVDEQVGRVLEALAASPVAQRTLIVLASDHGESLGEHEYYFDHGENLFDPSQRVPLIVVHPGAPGGRRSDALVSTLDLVPTLLDAVKVSYPPDLAGSSLLPLVEGRPAPRRERLFGQNERNLVGTWDQRYKMVATPVSDGFRYALFDRQLDPAETKDVSGRQAEATRVSRRELDLFVDETDREWSRIRAALSGVKGEEHLSPDACERLKSMGYIVAACK